MRPERLVRIVGYAGVAARGAGVDSDGDALLVVRGPFGRPHVLISLIADMDPAVLARLLRKAAAWLESADWPEAVRQAAQVPVRPVEVERR